MRNLADSAAREAAQLSANFGRLAEILQAVRLGEATGMSAAEVLRGRVADLNSQRVGMMKHIAELDLYVKAQHERFPAEISRCSALLISGPQKIESLRIKLKTYQRDRAAMVERLRAAGLDDEAIDRAGVTPGPSDRAEWIAQIEREERRLACAKEFIGSAPLFDLSLLQGIV
ncbi:conserved hypothetical protein [Paraburkholderia tropica]|nr:conserved hypothetical protein [Paraburkholderia tropica]